MDYASVLVTDNSRLIKTYFIPETTKILTIDSDFMMRFFALESGQIEKTIILKKEKNTRKNSKLDVCCLSTSEPF